MSYFSAALTTCISSAGLSLRDVEQKTGIDHTVLSRLTAGKIPPSEKNLAALCSRLNPARPTVALELVTAYLQDLKSIEGVDTSSISISYQPGGPAWWMSLPVSLQNDLEAVASEAAHESDMRALVAEWANVIRRHRASLARKVYPFPKSGSLSAAEHPGAIVTRQLLSDAERGSDSPASPASSSNETAAASAGSKKRNA